MKKTPTIHINIHRLIDRVDINIPQLPTESPLKEQIKEELTTVLEDALEMACQIEKEVVEKSFEVSTKMALKEELCQWIDGMADFQEARLSIRGVIVTRVSVNEE